MNDILTKGDSFYLAEYIEPIGTFDVYLRLYMLHTESNRLLKYYQPTPISNFKKEGYLHLCLNNSEADFYFRERKFDRRLIPKWVRGNDKYLIHNSVRCFYPYKNSLIIKRNPIVGETIEAIVEVVHETGGTRVNFINPDYEGNHRSYPMLTAVSKTLQQLLETSSLEHRVYLSPSAMKREMLKQLNII